MAKDYSGWGSDDKGEPMVMASGGGGGSGDGGGSGRVTQAVLAIAMVLALVLAGYAMIQLNATKGVQKGEIDELTKKHSTAVKELEAKLTRARATLAEDKDYAEALEADNAYMKARGRPYSVQPPVPPDRQKYIDELQRENAQRRRPGTPVTEVPKRNPWPSDTP